jgi:hypothetical protein
LLTEDLGEIVYGPGIDGRLGKAVRILGRVARAELRGCSMSLGQRRAHDCSISLYCGNNCRTPIALTSL